MKRIEIEETMKMEPQKRYEYFIKKVVDYEEVWSLSNDEGWVSSKGDDGGLRLNFWPTKEHADLCAVKEWKGSTAESIELEDFIENWLPGMKKDGINASIFYNNVDSIALPLKKILEDIESELDNY